MYDRNGILGLIGLGLVAMAHGRELGVFRRSYDCSSMIVEECTKQREPSISTNAVAMQDQSDRYPPLALIPVLDLGRLVRRPLKAQ